MITKPNNGQGAEGWEEIAAYQIRDAIQYCGINPKTSGGWTMEITRPIVKDLIERIKNKILPSLLAKVEQEAYHRGRQSVLSLRDCKMKGG